MGLSNLPPGCSSPYGGIYHEYESATDKLLDVVETAECANLLADFAPLFESHLRLAARDAAYEKQMEIVDIVSELFGSEEALQLLQRLVPVDPDKRHDT